MTIDELVKKYAGDFPDVEGRKNFKTWEELRQGMKADIIAYAQQPSFGPVVGESPEKLKVLEIETGQSFKVENTFFIAGKDNNTGKIIIFETNDPNYARQ